MTAFQPTSTGQEVVDALKQNIKGRTFIVTGAAAKGIGGAIATTLARGSPEQIIIVSRTEKNVEPVLAEIKTGNPSGSIKTLFVQCDLTDHASVRCAAETILKEAPRIHVLINNAGVMATSEYTKDPQGVEFQLSANHLGHFLLTNLLVPSLTAGGDARVVNISSQGYRASQFHFDDWNFSDGKTYEMWTAYGQSKTANILFAIGLTKRVKHLGVTSTSVHPGMIMGTNIGSHLDPSAFTSIAEITKKNTGREWYWDEPQVKTLEQGVATPLVAALDPEIPAKSPAYLANSQIEAPYEYASDAESAEKLWKLSEELVGQTFQY